MQGQIAIFIIAGYETTSTALGFTAHHLAVNPKVQKKLQNEVDKHFPKDVKEIWFRFIHILNSQAQTIQIDLTANNFLGSM